MVKLMDIAPREAQPPKTVPIQGQDIEIVKLSAKRITAVIARFPEVGALLGGEKVDMVRMVEIGAEAVAATIAAGCGYPGDATAEETASEMPIEDQLALVEAILVLSLPKVAAPLIGQLRGRIETFLATLNEPAAEEIPAETLASAA